MNWGNTETDCSFFFLCSLGEPCFSLKIFDTLISLGEGRLWYIKTPQDFFHVIKLYEVPV